MLLGTPKIWFVVAGLLFFGGLAVIGQGLGGFLGNLVGGVLLFAGVAVFAGAPMRYGRAARKAQHKPPPPIPAPATQTPAATRPKIAARDASEV